MSGMSNNTEFNTRYKVARFLVKYIDYPGCVSQASRKKYGKVRALGNLKEQDMSSFICKKDILPKNTPSNAKSFSWNELTECLYVSGGFNRLIKEFYHDRLHEKQYGTKLLQDADDDESKPCNQKQRKFLSLPSQQFCYLINDERFYETIRHAENVKRVLDYMWCPTRPVESVGQYAIAKHASIHYILSTHAILPSSECFTPEDIQRIMHLPMEWIGALPRQEDTRCITKFIARFAELFAQKTTKGDEVEDPLDKHARKCGQRVFMDIIRYASSGALPVRPPRKVRHTGSVYVEGSSFFEDGNEIEKYPPLDWSDQLSRTNVKIYDMPIVEKSTEPVYRPPKRKATNPCYIQEHTALLAVNDRNIMREATQVLTALEMKERKFRKNKDRYNKSRGLKRAVDIMQCSKILEKPMDWNCLSVREQLNQEEENFENLVKRLPHRLYDISNLKNISSQISTYVPPMQYSADWIVDPTDELKKSKPQLWNPNRRVFLENEIREQRSSPMYIASLEEMEATRRPSLNSIYESFRPSLPAENRGSGSKISFMSKRKTRLSIARPSTVRTSTYSGQRLSNDSKSMTSNNANMSLKLPPIVTGFNGILQQRPNKSREYRPSGY